MAQDPGARILIMLDANGNITAAHTNGHHVQILAIKQGNGPNHTMPGVYQWISGAPGGLSGWYRDQFQPGWGEGFDSLDRPTFVNRVFKMFGR